MKQNIFEDYQSKICIVLKIWLITLVNEPPLFRNFDPCLKILLWTMGQLIVNQLFQQGGIGKEFLPKNRTERETNLSGYCLVQFE